ncbi:putative metalloprotease CJM1_0395 family protein [Breoghania sp.]|uniref:putative metalloprotease CJM1_0395 family protein n=1 Tax=Breoghania sp. TaxID=2065378 RepID=UPI002AA613F0|nr:putative metalloprotease CJM1_0395 family protein [Breoghania sp.]
MVAEIGSHAVVSAAQIRPHGAPSSRAESLHAPDAPSGSAPASTSDPAVIFSSSEDAAGSPSTAKDTNAAASPGELTEDEEKQVRELKKRDAEVKAHERAHNAAGGIYAGAPTYETTRGPDGRTYAVGGEVAIDTSPAGSPQATIAKADQIVRAALAPADPSPQDLRVAAAARQMRAEAQAALLQLQAEEAAQEDEESEAAPAREADGSGDGFETESSEPRARISVDTRFAAQRAYEQVAQMIAPFG